MSLERERLERREKQRLVDSLQEEMKRYRDHPDINMDNTDFDLERLQIEEKGSTMVGKLIESARARDEGSDSGSEDEICRALQPEGGANDVRLGGSVNGSGSRSGGYRRGSFQLHDISEPMGRTAHESLLVDVNSNTVRRGNASPKSTRIANLQSFMFGASGIPSSSQKKHTKVNPEVSKEKHDLKSTAEASFRGESKERKGQDDEVSREESNEGQGDEQLDVRGAHAHVLKSKKEEEEEPQKGEEVEEEKSEKVSILKLLRSQKSALIAETKKLHREISELGGELNREEEMGSKKQSQLRRELERLQRERRRNFKGEKTQQKY